MTLRWFRDNFVSREDIKHYYDVAPIIVDKINSIPENNKIYKWIYEQESSIVFVEMPILFEISAQDHFDSIWCVVADLDVALSRLQTYRNFTREQALARLVSQMNPEEKMAKSDIVLQNNGTVEQLHKQIEEALKEEKVHGD